MATEGFDNDWLMGAPTPFATFGSTGWVQAGYVTEPPKTASADPILRTFDDLGEACRKAKVQIRQSEADTGELLRKITAQINKSFASPSARAGAKPGVGSHQKGTAVNLYPCVTKTLGGYRSQVTLDGDSVIWEGGTHGPVRDENGKQLDGGSRAANQEAVDKIEAVMTSLFAEPTTKAA